MIKKIINRIKKIFCLPTDIWQMFISYLPGEFGYSLRYSFWKKRLRHLGKDVRIDTGVSFQNPAYISIGDNSWVDRDVVIIAGIDKSKRKRISIKNKDFKGEPGVVYMGRNIHIAPRCLLSGISAGLYISDDCNVGPDCKFYAWSHHYRSRDNPCDPRAGGMGPRAPIECQYMIEGPIYIGRNVGIVMNSAIFPGASIPDNCLVTFSSLVYPGKHESNSILSGNPAKKVANRFKVAKSFSHA